MPPAPRSHAAVHAADCVGGGQRAHGFKFAAWLGRTLAELAAGRPKPAELAPFALDRPSLQRPFDRAGWLV
jgi:glycine/D-amino acid oxidase-like deaminating enzyme